MDILKLLEETGPVPPAEVATIDAVVELILSAASQEANPSTAGASTPKRRRRVVLGVSAVAAAALVVAIMVPAGQTPSSDTVRPSATNRGSAV